MTDRDRKTAAARDLRDEGLSYAAIGERVGVTKTCVIKWLNPERAREYNRRDSARPGRNAQKRAWDDANRKPCVECGARTGSYRATRCSRCYSARKLARTAERGHLIEGWWAEGLTLRQIGERLGWTAGRVGVEMHQLRKKGFDLPQRRPYYGGKRRAAA